jgi:putative Holliday junction resolvase
VSDTAPREGLGRVLGVDLGERRIGIAVGDARTGAVTPLRTLARARDPQEDARVLARLATEQRAGDLVVGLPLNADGSEGPQALGTREWAAAVAGESGLRLRFRDERLTSQRAERRIGGPARGRSGGPPSAARREAHRARIDREAAALILQDEFDARAEAPTGAEAGGAATTPRQEPGEQDR